MDINRRENVLYISVLTDEMLCHLFVDDAVGHSLRSQRRAKTLVVLPDSHAAFDAKIAFDASKIRRIVCFLPV